MIKKVLIVATVDQHIRHFHLPFIKHLINRGYQVETASFGEECFEGVTNKYNLPCTRSPFSLGNIKSYLKLRKIIDAENYDYIHCHTPVGGALTRFAARRARKKGTKVYYTAHGFHFYKGASLINWLIYYPVEWFLSRFTDLLITINKEDFDRASRCFKKARVAYVPGVGIDTRKFSVKDVDELKFREKLGISEDSLILLSVGELSKRKNQKVIIEAISKLCDKNILLLIAGMGPQEDTYSKLIDTYDLKSQVKLLGYRNDIDELCSISDIFIFPSKQEGLPVALMEAMAATKPAICSRIRGNVDLLQDEWTEFLIAPDDVNGFVCAIEKLSQDKDLMKSLGHYNYSRIQEFNIDNVIDCMSKFYR